MKIIVKVYQNDHSPPSKHNTYTPLQKWFSRPETGTCPSFTERLCLHVNHISCKARWGPLFSGGAFLFSCSYNKWAWLSGSHLGLPSGSPGFESDRRTEILRSLSWFGYSSSKIADSETLSHSGLLSFKKPEKVLWTIAKNYYYYIVWPWCYLFQHGLPVKILIRFCEKLTWCGLTSFFGSFFWFGDFLE